MAKSISELSLLPMIFPTADDLRSLTRFTAAADGLDHERIEDALRAINRRFTFPLKGRVLDLYTNNEVVLLGNRDRVKVPAAFPAWRIVGERGSKAYVNVTPYVPASLTTPIDNRKLYGLMQYGQILLDTFRFEAKVAASMPIAKLGALVYSRMMHRMCDRVLSVGIDPMRSDQTRYAFAKYFLIGMMGRQAGETTDQIAMGVVRGGTTAGSLQSFEQGLAAAAAVGSQAQLYRLGVMDFLAAYNKGATWASKLTPRAFVQNFMSGYGAPSMMAMEELGYFLATVGLHTCGCDIINGLAFDSVSGKDGEELIGEFARLVR